jgi:DNA-binding transcriptional MerR regulator
MARREYRVEELAAEVGISVELLRSYQSRGLVPPPRHLGRLALYETRHLERLRWIRDLKARGYSLRMIEQALDAGETAARPSPPVELPLEAGEEWLTLEEVAEHSGVRPAVLRSFEASGILRPRVVHGEERYTTADVRAVRMLLTLIGGGLPMEELMRVAHVQLEAAEQVAAGAVELFMRYGRGPLLHAGLPQKEEAERMVAALRLMIGAATGLMTYNFQRMVLNAAQAEIEAAGTRSERAALERELTRRGSDLSVSA